MQKYCSFFGHKFMEGIANLEQRTKEAIRKVILEENITSFLVGRNGQFDRICADCVKDLKEEFPFIKIYLVYAYLKKETDEYERKSIKETFDGTIYPPLENVPPKFAILKRNEWIVRESDFIVFYVDYKWGGSGKMLDYAKRKGKSYLNLGRAE